MIFSERCEDQKCQKLGNRFEFGFDRGMRHTILYHCTGAENSRRSEVLSENCNEVLMEEIDTIVKYPIFEQCSIFELPSTGSYPPQISRKLFA